MATVIPTYSSNHATCRTNIQSAIDGANDGDILRITNQGSATWSVAGRADPNGTGGDGSTLGGGGPGALGTIEFTKAMVLQLDAGITLQESDTSPITELKQPFLRWLNKSNVGITFGAGSKILGQKDGHAEVTEQMHGAKFIGCTGVTIAGSNEYNIDNFYGDGLIFESGGYPVLGPLGPNTGVVVDNLGVKECYRNGITIGSCVGEFNNVFGIQNYGTSPHCFMDIETDIGTELVGGTPDTIQVTINGGWAEGHSRAIGVHIANTLTEAILINISNFRSVKSTDATDNPWGYDFKVTATSTPAGSKIICNNLTSEYLKSAAFYFNSWKLDTACAIIMRNCGSKYCASDNLEKPFRFTMTGDPTGGGITFENCWIDDVQARALTQVSYTPTTGGLLATNVRGEIAMRRCNNPHERQFVATLPNLRVVQSSRVPFSKKARRSARRGVR